MQTPDPRLRQCSRAGLALAAGALPRLPRADFLANSGIPVLIDGKHPIAHNKIIIIDGETVITGSFNFTKQAEEHNAENLLVIHDSGLAQRYLANWHDHEAHSEPYTGRGEVAQRPANDREHHPKKKLGILEE